jgi:hypothetical protein
VINQREVGDTNDERDHTVDYCLTHLFSSSRTSRKRLGNSLTQQPYLAGALDAGKPIEKPETNRAGYIENHFADFHLDRTICCRRCHQFSFS